MPDIITFSLPSKPLLPTSQKSVGQQKQADGEDFNSDTFLVFFQPPEIPKDIEAPKRVEIPKKTEIPNIQTPVPVGPPNPQGIQQRITQLAQALKLTFNEAQRYYTDNAGAIYYPQLNGSFYVTGRRAKNGDPIQPLTVVLNQQTNQPQNQPERSRSLLHTMIIRELRLVPNNNWTFTSTLHPDVTFYLQLDGSVWGSNRTTYRLGTDNSLIQQRNSEPLPFTTAIPQLGLYPLRLDNPTNVRTGIVQGAFMKTGDPGMYIPQPDGTIYYTGRINPKTERDPGGPVGPYVYRRGVNGVWSIDRSDSRRSPMVGSLALSSTKAYQDANGNWLAPSDDTNPQPYNICMLNDGRVIRLRSVGSNLNISVFNTTSNTWTNVPSRDISTFGSSIHPSMLNVLRTFYTNQLGLRFDASKGCYTVNGEANPVLRGLGITAGEFHLQLDGTFFVTNARDLEGRPIMTPDRILGDRPARFTISSLAGSNWTKINERNTPIHGTIALTHLQTNLRAEVNFNDNWTFSHNNQSFSILPSGDFYNSERGFISFSPCLSVNARDREIARNMRWVRDVEDSNDEFGGRPIRFRFNNDNQSNLIFAPHRQIMSAYGINPVRQSNGRFISHFRTGEFSLQSDGSFFYSGGRDNQGRTFPASTILIGNDGNVTERTGISNGRNWGEALSSSAIIANRHLLPAGGGMYRTTLVGNDTPGASVSWSYSNRLHIPNYSDNSRANCFILPNNMLLRIDGSVFHENRWQPIFADNATFNRVVTPEVATMILNALGGRNSTISNHISRGATLTGTRPTQTELQAMNDLDLLRSYYNVLWRTRSRE